MADQVRCSKCDAVINGSDAIWLEGVESRDFGFYVVDIPTATAAFDKAAFPFCHACAKSDSKIYVYKFTLNIQRGGGKWVR